MFGIKTLTKHADLVNRMSATVGADFGEAVADGRLAAESLRSAVLRCSSCGQPDDCARWLAAHGQGADAPPGYCRNGELFSDLKARRP